MTRNKTSDHDILGHHLPYEFNMLQRTYQSLEEGGHDLLTQNALIESFSIHARALIEFFNNGPHCCKAKEFTDNAYTAMHIGSLGKDADKLNTQIAHLTRARTTNPTEKIGPLERKKWLAALEQEAQNFAEQLAPEFKGMFTPPKPIMMLSVNIKPSATNHITTK